MVLSGNCSCYYFWDQGVVVFNFFFEVIELNVGGQVYFIRYFILISIFYFFLWKMFFLKRDIVNDLVKDSKGRFFIDRDGFLFRYILDYFRDRQVVLFDYFLERGRLKREVEYFQFFDFVKFLVFEDVK